MRGQRSVFLYRGPQVGTIGQQARANSCCALLSSGFWALTVSGISARAAVYVCVCGREEPALKERNGNRQMSVIPRATGSVPAAWLAVLRTQVCARGRSESTAVPVGCQAAGLVVKELRCWIELAAFGPCSQTTSNTACLHSWIGILSPQWVYLLLCVYIYIHIYICISSSTVYQSGREEQRRLADQLVFRCVLLHDSPRLSHHSPMSFFSLSLYKDLSEAESLNNRKKIAVVLHSAASKMFC